MKKMPREYRTEHLIVDELSAQNQLRICTADLYAHLESGHEEAESSVRAQHEGN